MKSLFTLCIVLFLGTANTVFGQTTYTFNGDGNWSDSGNWVNGIVPPEILEPNTIIYINPDSENGKCILNVEVHIPQLVSLRIVGLQKFIVPGDLKLSYENTPDSTFTDPRDGKVYKFKHIGNQVWMTQNLNYEMEGSWCYDDLLENCATYGRLYEWNAGLSAAPPGWHIPSLWEWTNFIDYFGSNYIAGGKMKETGTEHWLSPNTYADNSSGFTALPGGSRSYLGTYFHLGETGAWWIAQNCGSGCQMEVYLKYDNEIAEGNYSGGTSESNGLAIRCIRD
ncbi:MAG: fibrobacter succinogenes major paralogous domain-containing protein [Ferruginibacter sp.]